MGAIIRLSHSILHLTDIDSLMHIGIGTDIDGFLATLVGRLIGQKLPRLRSVAGFVILYKPHLGLIISAIVRAAASSVMLSLSSVN